MYGLLFKGPVGMLPVLLYFSLLLLQVATWVLYPLIVGAFYALILPVLGDGWTSPLRLTMGAIYLSLHLWAARAAYVVTAADPADPLLSASEKYRVRRKPAWRHGSRLVGCT